MNYEGWVRIKIQFRTNAVIFFDNEPFPNNDTKLSIRIYEYWM